MTLTARPTAIPLAESSDFPPELVALPNWTAYDLEGRDGALTKMPIDPHNGRRAKSNDSTTWGTFAEAYAFAKRRGMGVMLMIAPPLVGIDIDDCRDRETGELTPVATSVVGEIDTYWEVSVSGTGLKGVAYGIKPGTRCRRKGLKIEIYSERRPFALTGQRLADSPLVVNDCQEGIDFIYGAAFGQEQAAQTVEWNPAAITADDDRAVIDWLHGYRNGAKFARYWGGQDDGDPSGGDQGMANMIAWRVGPDPARIEAIFNASARADRDKWQRRPAYRESTIRKAIDSCNGRFYEVRQLPRTTATSAPMEEIRISSEQADPELAPYLALSHEDLARRAYKAERFNKAYLRFDKNKSVKTQKPTLRAVLFEYENRAKAGRLDADGWAPSSLAALGDLGGASKDSAGDHLRDIVSWDIGIQKDVRDEEYRVPVADGREIVQIRPRLYIKVDGDVVDKLEELAFFVPPQKEGKNTWGGKREPCPRCGSTKTRTVTYCGDCDLILKETIREGDEPEELAVDEAGNIPPTPLAVPAAQAAYPPAEVTYARTIAPPKDHTSRARETSAGGGDDAAHEQHTTPSADDEPDDWDPYECNHFGCKRPVVIGSRWCGEHRNTQEFGPTPTLSPASASRPADVPPLRGAIRQTPNGPIERLL